MVVVESEAHQKRLAHYATVSGSLVRYIQHGQAEGLLAREHPLRRDPAGDLGAGLARLRHPVRGGYKK